MTGRPRLVLGRPPEVEAMAAALALAQGAAPVVVFLRDGEPPPLAQLLPATRHARRLVARLAEAGIEAAGRGRLAVVEAGEADPGALADRVAMACGGPPVVALLRARRPQDEALVAQAAAVLCEGPGEAATDLLLAELDRRRVPVTVQAAPAGLEAAAARAGFPLRLGGSSPGQASVEAVALAPLLLAVVLAAGQLLAAGVARELAGHAATAGAAALIQGRDGAGAARRALPGWSRRRSVVTVSGRRVAVRLRPPGPAPLAGLFEAREGADAGPEP